MSWMLIMHPFILLIMERMTNNMRQTFGKEKHFHVHTTLEPLVHTTLFLNNYVRYIN